MTTLNISLPDAMREWIDAQVESGEYANASDYVRDLIRHDQRQREALRLALIEGEQSGISPRKVSDIITATKKPSRD
jgi:antitoxin ParD1/3/4